MKKIFRILLALVVVLALVAIGGSWLTGRVIAGSIERHAAQANHMLGQMDETLSPHYLRIRLDSLESGIFSSVATWVVTGGDVQREADGAEKEELLVREKISHGPFPLSRLLRGKLMPVQYASTLEPIRWRNDEGQMQDWDSARLPLGGEVAVYFGGAFDARLHLDRFEDEGDVAGTRMDVSGVEVLVSVRGPDRRDLKTVFRVGKVNAANPGADVQLRDWEVMVETRPGEKEFPLKEISTRIGEMRISGDDEKQGIRTIASEDMHWGISTQTRGEYTDITHAYTIGDFRMADRSLMRLESDVALKALDTQALKNSVSLMGRFFRQQQKGFEPEGENSEKTLEEEIIKSLLEIYEAHPPEIEVRRAAIVLPSGSMGYSGTVQLGKPASWELSPDELLRQVILRVELDVDVSKKAMAEYMNNLAPIMGAITGTGAKALPQGEQMQGMVDAAAGVMVASGYFKMDGDNITSHISYADGAISINGKQHSLEELLAFVLLGGGLPGAGYR